jgi:O-antigen/teichoic acid export membrane protein
VILVILVATKKYIVFLGTQILLVIVTNAYASHVVNQNYPYLEKKERLPKEERTQIFSNMRNIFIKQFAGRVVDSTDYILISTLVSTLLVGYYSNYLVVIGVFKQLADKMMSAAMASLGNLFVTERTESKEATLTRLTFIFYIFASIASVGVFACVQPFIKLWLGEEYLLDYSVVAILCLLVVTQITYKPLSSAMHLSGFFNIGRNISFVSALVNLAVSIVLGMKIGLIGIFIGTMCTYTIEIVTKVHYLFKLYFQENSFRYVCFWLKMLLVFIVEMLIIYTVNLYLRLSTFPALIINGFVSVLLTFVMITLVFGRSDAYLFSKRLIKRYLRKYLRKMF